MDGSRFGNGLVPLEFVSYVSDIERIKTVLDEMRKKDEQSFVDRWTKVKVFSGDRYRSGLYNRYTSGISHIGYRKALRGVMEQRSSQFFDEEWLYLMNVILTGNYEDKEERFFLEEKLNDILTGNYKEQDLRDDNLGVITKLAEVYYETKRDKRIHPLLNVSDVVYELLSVGGFAHWEELRCLLIHRLLVDNGYDVGKYDLRSIPKLGALVRESLQENVGQTAFAGMFLLWLKDSYERVLVYMTSSDDDRMSFSTTMKQGRIRKVLMEAEWPISKAEICELLPDVSLTTIEQQLGVLCRAGIIEMQGSRRCATYIWKKRKEEEDEDKG